MDETASASVLLQLWLGEKRKSKRKRKITNRREEPIYDDWDDATHTKRSDLASSYLPDTQTLERERIVYSRNPRIPTISSPDRRLRAA